MINSLIQEELLFPITIISCLRLFVNSFLTDWQHQFLFTVLPIQQPTNSPSSVHNTINVISEPSQNPQPKHCQCAKLL